MKTLQEMKIDRLKVVSNQFKSLSIKNYIGTLVINTENFTITRFLGVLDNSHFILKNKDCVEDAVNTLEEIIPLKDLLTKENYDILDEIFGDE